MNAHDLIDAYVDGTLSGDERRDFEARLAADPALAAEVEATRSLVAELRALPDTAPPTRDLWPGVEEALEPGPRWGLWLGAGAVGGGALALAAAAVLVLGVGLATGLFRAPASTETASTEVALAPLRDGDLPTAHARLEARLDEAASADRDIDLLVGSAYTCLLRGTYGEADAHLERAQRLAGPERQPDLALRRAVVALQAGDLSAVQRHGRASGLPAGLVFAAEVHLADAEVEAARPLLERAAAGDDPRVRATAATYLAHLDDRESGRALLAEAAALWALGQRESAVEVAVDLLPALPDWDEARDADLLLWAGRAATSDRPDLADALLDHLTVAPEGQAWRVVATRAIAMAARGEQAEAERLLRALAVGGAPADGLHDAVLTTAAVSEDRAFRQRLLDEVPDGPGPALLLGDPDRATPGSPLSRFLGGG